MSQEEIISYFQETLEKERVLINKESLQIAASDHTEDLVYFPQMVILPKTTEEVSKILKFCNQHQIIITPRGAGTGLAGGCLPVNGGIVIDMRLMNKILNIDTDNFQVTTEPGVITETLQNAVADHGMFYPVDPASRGSCFIGGNVAQNSGGARAVKYGVVKDYVLNLEVVLPDGSIIWTGANTLKNSTGYNLTQLIVGSEGTLAIITKIVFRLLPLPRKDLLILVPFHSSLEACESVSKIFMAGFDPSALEFMETNAVKIAQKFINDYSIQIDEDVEAFLMIEVNGNDEDVLMKDIEAIAAVLESFKTGEILFAGNQKDKEKFWKLRRVMGEAAKNSSIYKEEDTVVPRAMLPQLLAKVKTLGKEYGFDSICYGHAGDGNLHVNILKNNMNDENWNNVLPKAIRILFEYVKTLGGTISGEHGIGLVQKQYMDIVFSPVEIQLMQQIKNIFDPNNILNPGKILPN